MLMQKAVRDALSHKRRVDEEAAAAAAVAGAESLSKRPVPVYAHSSAHSSAPAPAPPRTCSKHPHALLPCQAYTAACCDLCKRALRAGDEAWRCSQCDFDACGPCLAANELQSPPPSPQYRHRRVVPGDELFSPAYLAQRLLSCSSSPLSPRTLLVLRENEVDVFLLRKLGEEGLRDALGLSDARETEWLVQLAHDEFARSLRDSPSTTTSYALPNEFFSYVFFVSKLAQSKLVSRKTTLLLGGHEVDLCLLAKLGDEGLHALGLDDPVERCTVMDFAKELEGTLSKV